MYLGFTRIINVPLPSQAAPRLTKLEGAKRVLHRTVNILQTKLARSTRRKMRPELWRARHGENTVCLPSHAAGETPGLVPARQALQTGSASPACALQQTLDCVTSFLLTCEPGHHAHFLDSGLLDGLSSEFQVSLYSPHCS